MDVKQVQTESKAELSFGEQAGKLLHISDVSSGLECDCICPACKTPLVARKGDVRKHHFAHHQGTDSEACLETVLHCYAKQVIEQHKQITLPEDSLHVTAKDLLGNVHQKKMLITGSTVHFEKVGLEVLRGSYRADATGFPYENQELDIEIRVTHKVDEEKRQKVTTSHHCMMEIDLSSLERDATPEQITQAVLIDAPRQWINNPVHEKKKVELQQQVDQLAHEANKEIMEKLHSNSTSLTPTNPDNFILLGYKVGHGYSPRYQKNFELSKLYTSRPVVSTNTRNFTVSDSGGFEMEEFDLDESCIKQLESLSFPVEVQLIMGSKLHGRKFVPVVLDIKTC